MFGFTGKKKRKTLAVLGLAMLVVACAAPQREALRSTTPGEATLAASVFLSSKGPVAPDAAFHFPFLDAGKVRLSLRSVETRPMDVSLSCDGESHLRASGERGQGRYLRAGSRASVRLPARGTPNPVRLTLSPEATRCQLHWGDGRRLTLLREDIGDPAVAAQDAASGPCGPVPTGLSPLQAAFFREDALSQTCAVPTGPSRYFPDPFEALQYRLEKLTGSRIPMAALERQDPDMPLDFSRAPRFEQIVVSYLHIRADLTGYLVARALAFHAARGTKVRIVGADSLMLEKERHFFEPLAAKYPGVQLQYYRFEEAGLPSGSDLVDKVQRTHHVKIFLGLGEDPHDSFAIIGGRNLHDGFFQPKLKALPDHPFLRSYEPGTKGFLSFLSSYEDFEIALERHENVADLASHFGKFWNRDQDRQAMAAHAAAGRGTPAQRDGLVRHFMSLPWADGQALETRYRDLLAAAQHSIDIMTPFNYPPEPILKVLEDAMARGVKVRIITRFNSDEPAAIGTWALNTMFFDENQGLFDMRAYNPGEKLPHAKLVIIDGELSVIGSVNLNQRSFFHDTENGWIFLDRKVAARVRREFERFWRASNTEITTPPMPFVREIFERFPGIIHYF